MNVILKNSPEACGQAPFREAARALGLDTFTLYTLIQRDRIAPVFAAGGEVVVAANDVAKLAAKKDVP